MTTILTKSPSPLSLRDTTPRAAKATRQAAFRANGYFHASGLINASRLNDVHRHATRMVFLHHARRVSEVRHVWDAPSLQLRNSWQMCDSARLIVCSRAIAQRAAELLDARAVQLYSDVIVTKEPGCEAAPWHHDAAHIPVDPAAVIVAWIPLSDEAESPPRFAGHCAGLSIRPGSHNFRLNSQLRPELPVSLRRFARQLRSAGIESVDLHCRRGDVVFYAGLTSHRVRANRSGEPVTAMAITYVRAGTPLLRPINDTQNDETRLHLSGLTVGRPLHTPLHPLLWSE